jgi:hypothetical protein
MSNRNPQRLELNNFITAKNENQTAFIASLVEHFVL